MYCQSAERISGCGSNDCLGCFTRAANAVDKVQAYLELYRWLKNEHLAVRRVK